MKERLKTIIRFFIYGVIPHIKMYLPDCIQDLIVHRFIKNGGLHRKIWGNEIFKDAIAKNVQVFLSDQEKSDDVILNRYTFDMVKSYLFYGIVPEEYFCFYFDRLTNRRGRRKVLSIKTKDLLCLCKYNARNVFRQLEDKYAFYSFNKKYFKRNILKIDKVSEYEQFSNFVHTNKNFIMKPLSGQCGEGISIYKEVNSNLDQLFSKFKSISGGVVLETLVVQSKIMAIWNETSVNTVRIPSFRTRKGIYVLQPFFKNGKIWFLC